MELSPDLGLAMGLGTEEVLFLIRVFRIHLCFAGGLLFEGFDRLTCVVVVRAEGFLKKLSKSLIYSPPHHFPSTNEEIPPPFSFIWRYSSCYWPAWTFLRYTRRALTMFLARFFPEALI